MSTPRPPSDAARRLVVERDLVAAAFGHLTHDAFIALPFDALAPTKALLKRFFSAGPWGPEDDEALADAVGPGQGEWRRPLDPDLTLHFGWADGRFRLSVVSTVPEIRIPSAVQRPPSDPLVATLEGPVVPEATPNPRTMRFGVGPIHDGPGRWYPSSADVDDGRVARLFDEFDEVANVLVGRDFVAVGLDRAADWERLLRPVLAAVTEEFAPHGGGDRGGGGAPPRGSGGPPWTGAPDGGGGRGSGRLDRAWRELGSLRPADEADLAKVLEAVAHEEPARRQVAATLLREAAADVAAEAWARLVGDPVRSVRRAAVDAMVDAGREELRALLEAALGDSDAWIRWKALRGLAELGAGPSRDAIAIHVQDPDFHVRLEATIALRSVG